MTNNVSDVIDRVRKSALNSGRNPDDIIIVAATKTVDAKKINEAVEAGIKYVAENRVQEFREKTSLISPAAKQHFIGHLQTNKAKYIVGKVELIQSADSEKLLDEIQRLAEKQGIIQKVLIEVNASQEKSKFGVEPCDVEKMLINNEKRSNVRVCGLMTIGPNYADNDNIRQVFRNLYNLFLDISQKKYHNSNMEFLSMGMSTDFEIAIEEGANIIRVGTAIFGSRN